MADNKEDVKEKDNTADGGHDDEKESDESPHPCVCLIGSIGDGKSSFGNTLLHDHKNGKSPFRVRHNDAAGIDKCKIETSKFLNGFDCSFDKSMQHQISSILNQNLTVIDTPGFDGSNFVSLFDEIKGLAVSTFTIVVSAANPRMEPIVLLVKKYKQHLKKRKQVALRMMQELTIVYTHWSYDKKSKKKREKKGITKEMRKKQINDALEEAFGKEMKDINVSCFFIDNEVLMDEDSDDDEKIEVLSELKRYYDRINRSDFFITKYAGQTPSMFSSKCKVLQSTATGKKYSIKTIKEDDDVTNVINVSAKKTKCVKIEFEDEKGELFLEPMQGIVALVKGKRKKKTASELNKDEALEYPTENLKEKRYLKIKEISSEEQSYFTIIITKTEKLIVDNIIVPTYEDYQHFLHPHSPLFNHNH